ncbi:hypothetical protein Acr_00g0053190 [Actinidia rufa]|uniref:Uncharacterized protein n=1 Tax=Actinidia rufa TaxID=165716 RepID=A0A7J0DLA3_9ERIC|nr:hypothetical protein Acr_00g0053190 [Actinidia rufa]
MAASNGTWPPAMFPHPLIPKSSLNPRTSRFPEKPISRPASSSLRSTAQIRRFPLSYTTTVEPFASDHPSMLSAIHFSPLSPPKLERSLFSSPP